jgi:methionine-rich copper-binding protein CopC
MRLSRLLPSLRRVAIAALFAALAPAFTPMPAAEAHAIIMDSAPAPGATAPGPDVPIQLRFNSRIDASRSRLSLLDDKNHTTALTLESSAKPDVLVTKAAGLAPGAYRLRWQVLAVDGHITRGEVPFLVGTP